MQLLSSQSVRMRLQQAGIWSKKSLGQHFLIDQSVLELIVASAGLNPSDTVLEIGPGLGVLSRELLARVHKVIAFELDTNMLSILSQDLPELKVVAGDVLKTAPQVVKSLSNYKIVANIPYQITTPLIRLFLEGGVENAPESLTLLVQREVGERLAAPATTSSRGYLSVLCQYLTDITYIQAVPQAAFWPAPAVQSAVIHLQVKKDRPFSLAEEKKFFRFVHTLFIQPRKQLKNVIAGLRGISAAEVEERFKQLGLPSTTRAQELTVEQWQDLYQKQF